MKDRFYLILAGLFIFSFPYLSAAGSYSYETEQMRSTDTETFQQSMERALQAQRNKIQRLKGVVFDLKAPVIPGAGSELVNDTVMLEVKETLYKNFINSPVTQDSQFQSKLLRIMNQTTITEDDLRELQRAADEARIRLGR
jgi:hypothetical protein